MNRLLSAAAVLAFVPFGLSTPASAKSDQQWYLDFLHVSQAQAISQGLANIICACLAVVGLGN